jgi:hypothetical protein
MKSYDDIVAWLTPYAAAAPESPPSPQEEEESTAKAKSPKASKVISAAEFAEILTDTSREEGVHVVAVRTELGGVSELDLAVLHKKCYGALFCEEFVCPPSSSDLDKELDESVARFCQGGAGGIPAEPYLLVVPYTPADRAKVGLPPPLSLFLSAGWCYGA